MNDAPQPLLRRVTWFVLLWCGGVVALGTMVVAIRWAMAA